MKQVDLSSFAENRPNQAEYIQYLSDFLSYRIANEHNPVDKSLPTILKQLRSFDLGPMHLFSELQKPQNEQDFGRLIGNYLGLLNFYPSDTEFVVEMMSGVLDVDMIAFFENLGMDQTMVNYMLSSQKWLHDGERVVEMTPELGFLLSKTDTRKSIEKMPVCLLRSAMPNFYLDMRNLPRVPQITDLDGNVLLVDGVLFMEKEIDFPNDLEGTVKEYYERQIQVQNAIKSGMINPEGKLIAHDYYIVTNKKVKALTKEVVDEVTITNFSYMFDPESQKSISEVCSAFVGDRQADESTFLVEQLMDPVSATIDALLYMTLGDSYREEIKPTKDLIKQIKTTSKEKKKRRLEKDLANSYDVLRIGRQYRMDIEGELPKGSSGDGSRIAHPRIGHWRPQAYGPKWSQLRTIWVKPVIVGQGKVKTKKVKLQ
ncbi:hypothetical protein QTV43_000444 [Vibrio vulnificus]|nr:hypothetical protein [Vibrio vulnificus]